MIAITIMLGAQENFEFQFGTKPKNWKLSLAKKD